MAEKSKKRYLTNEDKEAIINLDMNSALTQREIAKLLGFSPQVVSNILKGADAIKQYLTEFRSRRSDALTARSVSILELQGRLDLSFHRLTDEQLDRLSVRDRADLKKALTIEGKTVYEQERLELGQSTSNVQQFYTLCMAEGKQVVSKRLSTTEVVVDV